MTTTKEDLQAINEGRGMSQPLTVSTCTVCGKRATHWQVVPNVIAVVFGVSPLVPRCRKHKDDDEFSSETR